MSPLLALILCYHLTYTLNYELSYDRYAVAGGLIPPQISKDEKNNDNSNLKNTDEEISFSINSNNANQLEQHPTGAKKSYSPSEKPPEVKVDKSSTPISHKNTTVVENKFPKPAEMESGALLRGVAVVAVLTALVLVYMALKTYCGKRGRNPAMVNKYGVKTRRSDIEMTPLPLDEDEEDETLFEVGNTNR